MSAKYNSIKPRMHRTRKCKDSNSHYMGEDPYRFTMDDHLLSVPDCIRYQTVLQYWALMICDIRQILDSEYHIPGISRLLSNTSIIQMMKGIVKLDVGYVQSQLKALLLAFRQMPHKGISSRCAHRTLRRQGVEWCGDQQGQNPLQIIQALVAWSLQSNIRKADKAILLKHVNSILQFTVRLTLNDVDWIMEDAIQDYLQQEEEMKTWTYDPSIVDGLRAIVSGWYKDFDFITKSPTDSHGYGATKDVRRSAGTAEKWLKMIDNQGRQHCLVSQQLGIVPHEEVEKAYSQFYNTPYVGGPEGTNIGDRFSIFQFVPKGINRKRGVSMEDTPNQYYQKILFDRMDKHFNNHPRMEIDLHDQEKSRWLAQFGSKSGLYGTLDLSCASDTVTWTLVKSVFRDCPRLLSLFIRLRTRKTYLKDADIMVDMEKAFPMGSALCFPLECTIFAAIIELANRNLGVWTYYRVYGDDMVVHKSIAHEVCRLLEELHFKLNKEKSYMPGSAFTEACGGEYWQGIEIEPLRVSRKFDPYKLLSSTKSVSTQLESARCLANDAYEYGYTRLRRRIIRDAKVQSTELLFANTAEGWHSPDCQNQKLIWEYVSPYKDYGNRKGSFGWRVRTVRPVSEIGKPLYAEPLRLERWFECRAEQVRRFSNRLVGPPEVQSMIYAMDAACPNVGHSRTRMKRKWVYSNDAGLTIPT